MGSNDRRRDPSSLWQRARRIRPTRKPNAVTATSLLSAGCYVCPSCRQKRKPSTGNQIRQAPSGDLKLRGCRNITWSLEQTPSRRWRACEGAAQLSRYADSVCVSGIEPLGDGC